MRKRTRLQQDAHNQRRRELKKEAREATFCMGYILRKYPSIYNEASQLYKKLNKRYPNKRDLTKTYEFKHPEDQEEPINNNTVILQPQLEIPLMMMMNNNDPMQKTNDPAVVEEMPLLFPDIQNEEIERIINELREDPDLASVFDQIHLGDVQAFETTETTLEKSQSWDETERDEIANIVQELNEDPNLAKVLNDSDVQAFETTETTLEKSQSWDETERDEIANIVQELNEDPNLAKVLNDTEFDHLGEDLPELEDEQFW